jgi:formate hydrogenlyase subunit 3/multisubunit Na+/H+ antiporter MnhD subunit
VAKQVLCLALGFLELTHVPSHVSAMMSGNAKMGIYGILRTLSFLTPVWLGWLILLLEPGRQ